MGNYYSRRKSRKHINIVVFFILVVIFLFLVFYAKASSSSSLDHIHHQSTRGSVTKQRALDPTKLNDLSSNDASRYINEGGENVFEVGKRRVFTGPNPLHNR
ncbi:unnamed protein product [Cochlearia groenlandica]